MERLSKFQQAKIVIEIIEDLKSIEDKRHLTIEPNEYGEDSDIFRKISEKSGIQYRDRCEAGIVSINEFISITFDNREDELIKKSQGRSSYHHNSSPFQFPGLDVPDSMKEAVKEFEKKNIPTSGPCKTRIGELFRAIQRIQYRAYNDGDLPWIVGSPTFMSYMFLMSDVDRLLYLGDNYNSKTGNYEFQFTDPVVAKHSYDGRIFTECDDSLCNTLDITKYQLFDLLQNEKIKDESNDWDSRDYTEI